MNPHIPKEKMDDLYEGRLHENEIPSLEEHIQDCKECEEKYQQLVKYKLEGKDAHIPSFNQNLTNEVMIPKINKPLTCIICNHNKFYSTRKLLNTRILTFFNLEWLNRTAQCHVCAECGYIHWFWD